MKSNPLVSVIIPAYNCEKYLDRALSSVMNQTWPQYECIVIDDGSTDKTSDVAKQWEDKIRYEYQENAGASTARNRGIELAQGELIAFLDADDSWVETKLESQIILFQQYPELALVCTGTLLVKEASNQVHSNLYAAELDPSAVEIYLDFGDLIENPYLATSTVMVPTKLARSLNGFDANLRTAEDLDFYFKCCWERTFAKINQQLVYKADIDESLGNGPDTYLDNLFVIDRFCKNYPDTLKRYEKSIHKQKSHIYSRWISYSLYLGNGVLVRSLLKEAEQFEIKGKMKYLLKSFFCHLIAKLKNRQLVETVPVESKKY